MLHHPPRSPLFPYTTLFRSETFEHARPVPPGDADPRVLDDEYRLAVLRANVHVDLSAGPGVLDGVLDEVSNQQGQDRESTRLNSSHRCISYAVFCLKKKTQR